jgi:SET domain-containing protein
MVAERRRDPEDRSQKFMTRPRGEPVAKARRSFVPRASRFHLSIRRSPIHRFGVFALELIPSRRRVIEYTGQRISPAEAQKRWDRMRTPWKLRRVYFLRLNRRQKIDPSVGGSGAEFINHSCTPNLRPRRIRGRVFFCSRRIIRKGEELTLNYNFRRDVPKVKCLCGSPKCRGTINRK